MTTRKVLGRGIGALIPDVPKVTTVSAPSSTANHDYFLCPIEKIEPGRTQPRQYFDQDKLDELVASIREQGVIQPLVVRPSRDGKYSLIAGERRWRAAQRAGVQNVPVVIRQVDDLRAFEMALVENLQRSDLNPLEEAEAYQRLIDEHQYTQDKLAERVGKDRTTITNCLRLLKLPELAAQALVAGTISAGHARALLGLEDQILLEKALREVVKRSLSVRQAEDLVRKLRKPPKANAVSASNSANVRDLQDRLCQTLKTKVRLSVGKNNKGKIEISYNSLDELDRLLEVLLK